MRVHVVTNRNGKLLCEVKDCQASAVFELDSEVTEGLWTLDNSGCKFSLLFVCEKHLACEIKKATVK